MIAERKPRPLTDGALSRQRSQLRLALARAKYELELFDDLDRCSIVARFGGR
jgi:hypothetical protein